MRASPQSDISILIPCYNEAGNLAAGRLEEVIGYGRSSRRVCEILVIDDGSTDGSPSYLEPAAFAGDIRLIRIPHSGKPAAIWAGMQEAAGALILMTDMDQSTPIEELDKLLPWFGEGYDIVIGSRGRAREGLSPIRRTGSYFFGHLRRLVLLKGIVDTQCGFKATYRRIALEIFPQLTHIHAGQSTMGWKVTAFDVEMLYLAQHSGYHIKEVEVSWQDRDVSSTKCAQNPGLQYLQESFEMAREVVHVIRNKRLGFYDRAQV